MHLPGVHDFSKVFEIFRSFSSVKPLTTTACKTFLTGAPCAQMNYVYDLDSSRPEALSQDFILIQQTHIPVLIFASAEDAGKFSEISEKNNIIFLGGIETKYISLQNFSYTPRKEIVIKQVTSDMLELWRDLAAEGFGYPRACDAQIFDDFCEAQKELNNTFLYIAYMDNVPVGQSMLVFTDSFAANMWSSVLPPYRKQGILTEMIHHRMKIAKDNGYQTITVQCMPMSAPVYNKLGYRDSGILNSYTFKS